jgi:hypothetical protein
MTAIVMMARRRRLTGVATNKTTRIHDGLEMNGPIAVPYYRS